MKKYASFLICFHEAHTDIYLSGIPLAVVHGDDVSPCFLSGANGEKRQINLGAIPDCPFSSVEELHEAVVDTLSKFSKTNFEDAPRAAGIRNMNKHRKTYLEWLAEKKRPVLPNIPLLTEEEFQKEYERRKSPLYGLESIHGLMPPAGLSSTYLIHRNGKTYEFEKAISMGVFLDGSSPIELLPKGDEWIFPEAHGCPRVRDQESMDRAIKWIEEDWPRKKEEYREHDIRKFFLNGCWGKALKAFYRM